MWVRNKSTGEVGLLTIYMGKFLIKYGKKIVDLGKISLSELYKSYEDINDCYRR